MVLVERHSGEMLSVATLFEPRRQTAEQLVEEAWGLVLTELASADAAPSFRL